MNYPLNLFLKTNKDDCCLGLECSTVFPLSFLFSCSESLNAVQSFSLFSLCCLPVSFSPAVLYLSLILLDSDNGDYDYELSLEMKRQKIQRELMKLEQENMDKREEIVIKKEVYCINSKY